MSTIGSFRRLITEITPPVILRIYRAVLPAQRMLSGNYRSWDEALAHASGYGNPSILEKVRTALLRVKSGEAACERDSVTFETKQYSFPVLAGLQRPAFGAGGRLRVLDYGGSLGSSYFLYRDFLKPLTRLSWHVVEQPAFVDCGKKEFENDELSFFGTLEESLQAETPDVVLFSSVLQYLEYPHRVMAMIAGRGPRYIIIDRTPFHDSAADLITVQNVPPEIYQASYPSWVFGTSMAGELAVAGYRVLAEWKTDEGTVEAPGITASYRGLLLEHTKDGPA